MCVLIPMCVAIAMETTLKPHELLDLADECLAREPHHPRVTRWLLASIAMRESGGNPKAVGDHGHAVGLFQFHVAAWSESCRVSWRGHYPLRTDATESMIAAIRYLTRGANALDRAYGGGWGPELLATWHNTGHVCKNTGDYGRQVVRIARRLQAQHR